LPRTEPGIARRARQDQRRDRRVAPNDGRQGHDQRQHLGDAEDQREGLRQYSLLADTYNRAFEQKWVAGQAPPDEPLLGSSDIQSLADLGNSFGMIREMKPFPFSRQQILQIAVIASLPGLPLIFLVMPVGELLKLLAGALL
jgi:hypothetical protein